MLLASPVFILYITFAKCKNQGKMHILKTIVAGLISSIKREFCNYPSLLTMISNLLINMIDACRMSNALSMLLCRKALLGVAVTSGRA